MTKDDYQRRPKGESRLPSNGGKDAGNKVRDGGRRRRPPAGFKEVDKGKLHGVQGERRGGRGCLA